VVGRASSPVLVGRGVEIAQLEAMLAQAAAGESATVVVGGEAGVGKTRLVAELIDQARARGALALTGGCLEVGDGVLPFAPVAELLRELRGSLDEVELARVLGGARGYLQRLVPELATAGEAVGPALGAPGHLFELLLDVVHRLAEQGSLLVVIEDLQ
jgi:predicted ATPase